MLFYQYGENEKVIASDPDPIMINKRDIVSQIVENEELAQERVISKLKDVEGNKVTKDSFKRINKKMQLKTQKEITRKPSYETQHDNEDEEGTKIGRAHV